jgi:hypothetical protein
MVNNEETDPSVPRQATNRSRGRVSGARVARNWRGGRGRSKAETAEARRGDDGRAGRGQRRDGSIAEAWQ